MAATPENFDDAPSIVPILPKISFSVMLHSTDFVLNHDRLILLDDETSSGHKDTCLEILIFPVAGFESQMRNCNLNQLKSPFALAVDKVGRQEFPNGVDFASGLPPRIAPSSGVISTTPV